MSEADQTSEARPAWYADKDVPVLMYRINRRDLPMTLFESVEDQTPPPFLDHLAECLLFGTEVSTIGRGHQRWWRLGNRDLNPDRGYLAGWVGYRSDDAEAEDTYDDATQEWNTVVVEREKRATAPFVVVDGSRFLFVARHPSFAAGTPATVFEMLLNQGESERSVRTTEWAVEPVLDTAEFREWLSETAVLDSVSFHVRLPNPDAAESFAQLDAHLRAQDAESFDHKLNPRDPDRGLNRDFTSDPISLGLLEMARRAFATVKAKGRNAAGGTRVFNQRDKVRQDVVPLPGDHDAAESAVIEHALNRANDEDIT